MITPRIVLAAAVAVFAAPAIARSPPDPLPPVGGPGVYRGADAIAAALAAHAEASPAIATSRILITDRYSIQEVRKTKAAPPAVHATWSELHYILDGSGEITTGGKIVGAGASAHIEGGVAQAVHKGDAIMLAPGTPHAYTKVNGALTYLEVRFADPNLASTPKAY